MFLPGTAVDIALADDSLSRKTSLFLKRAERRRKGRGWRVVFETMPEKTAGEICDVLEARLIDGGLGIAEAAALRTAIERLGGVVSASNPQQEERRVQARMRALEKAREARSAKAREKAEKIESYERASAYWLSNHRSLPLPSELQEGHARSVAKLNQLAKDEFAATERVKALHGERGRTKDEIERAELSDEIRAATINRDDLRKQLRKQRYTMSSPERQQAADLPIPQPEDFGLTREDVKLSGSTDDDE